MTTGEFARSSAFSAPATTAPTSTAATDSPPAPASPGATGTPDAPGVRDQIVAEHQALREVLARVETAPDLDDLLALLAELQRLLISHFATEEADEGFERLLGRRAPHLLGGLDAVLSKHCEILADLNRLAGNARACLDGPVAEVRQQAAALAARLHAHEEKETELLVGAMYDDLGIAS